MTDDCEGEVIHHLVSSELYSVLETFFVIRIFGILFSFSVKLRLATGSCHSENNLDVEHWTEARGCMWGGKLLDDGLARFPVVAVPHGYND